MKKIDYNSNEYEKIYQECIKNPDSIKNLSIKTGIPKDTLSRHLKKRGFITNTNGKFEINSNIFNIINTEKKAYWLGFIYADGCVYTDQKNHLRFEIGLQKSDKSHLSKLKKFLKSKHKIRIKESSQSCQFGFTDKQICKDLIKLGCVQRKSLILTFPIKTQVPKNLISHFIRGYVDGDGSIYYANYPAEKYVLSILGTKEFLTQMMLEIGIVKTLYKNKRHLNNTYFIQYSVQKELLIVLDWLYKDANIYLKRKNETYLKFKKWIHEKESKKKELKQL
jgi:hypothetical protein